MVFGSPRRKPERLWPDTFISDANLANLVADLRQALGDDAKNPRIIRTVRRFGYALIWGDPEISLSEGANILGRERDAVVWLDVYSVSRHHARITATGEEAVLEDLGSKNGTFLRGQALDGPQPVRDGDEIRIGTVNLTLRRFTGFSTQTARSQGVPPHRPRV